MPKVIRTAVLPGNKVMHDCVDVRGKKVRAEAWSNTRCVRCNTQIVYVFGHEEKK